MTSPSNVTLRQLRAFLAVAEERQFTRAADRLGVSQSAVSTLIRELEGHLELRLFDRHTRMLRLTQAGEEAVPLARKAVGDLDLVLGNLGELQGLGRGRVSIAASSLQAALFVPGIIQAFNKRHPAISVTLHDVPQPQVLDLVRSGDADFGLGTEPNSRHDLAAQVVASDTFVCVMPPGHALARCRELSWVELAKHPVIGSPAGDPLREQLDFMLAREGISLTRSHQVSLPLTIVGMVEAGMGVAVLTSNAARLVKQFGLSMREISQPVLRRDISLLFSAERSLSPAAQQFRSAIVKMRPRMLHGVPIQKSSL